MNDQFELLDDPVPYTVDPAAIARAKQRGLQLRRRRRLGLTGAAVPVVLLLVLLGGLTYVDHRAGEVHRVDVGSSEVAPVAGQPFNILVVGTDGPRGQAGVRTDTIMVVHVDEAANRIEVLSIPRDLSFDESGSRIDELLGTEGAEALIDTIHTRLGIEISHFVEVDAPGLAELIDQVGGIQVNTLLGMQDANTGLDLAAGCNTLDGQRAVALIRSRHVAVPSDTSDLTYDGMGELGREARQQAVVAIIGRKLLTMPVDSSSFSTLLDVFADHTTMDAGFGRSELLDLARWGHGLDPTDLTTATLPVTPFPSDAGGEVLHATSDSAAAVSAFLRGDGQAMSTWVTTPSGSIKLTTAPSMSITACS